MLISHILLIILPLVDSASGLRARRRTYDASPLPAETAVPDNFSPTAQLQARITARAAASPNAQAAPSPDARSRGGGGGGLFGGGGNGGGSNTPPPTGGGFDPVNPGTGAQNPPPAQNPSPANPGNGNAGGLGGFGIGFGNGAGNGNGNGNGNGAIQILPECSQAVSSVNASVLGAASTSISMIQASANNVQSSANEAIASANSILSSAGSSGISTITDSASATTTTESESTTGTSSDSTETPFVAAPAFPTPQPLDGAPGFPTPEDPDPAEPGVFPSPVAGTGDGDGFVSPNQSPQPQPDAGGRRIGVPADAPPGPKTYKLPTLVLAIMISLVGSSLLTLGVERLFRRRGSGSAGGGGRAMVGRKDLGGLGTGVGRGQRQIGKPEGFRHVASADTESWGQRSEVFHFNEKGAAGAGGDRRTGIEQWKQGVVDEEAVRRDSLKFIIGREEECWRGNSEFTERPVSIGTAL